MWLVLPGAALASEESPAAGAVVNAVNPPLAFFSLTPYRAVDTRIGGSPLVAGIERTLPFVGDTCPGGTAPLQGTGMQASVFVAGYGTGQTGGGTPWLTVAAPIVPGEIIELDLMIFDVSDNIFDSLVLFDNFRWVP